MTPKRIAELRALIAKATEGPWTYDVGNGQVESTEYRIEICNRVGNVERREDLEYRFGDLFDDLKSKLVDDYHDLRLIAESRRALPEALDEIDSLTQRICLVNAAHGQALNRIKEQDTEIERLRVKYKSEEINHE